MKKGPPEMLDVRSQPRGSHSHIPVMSPRQSSQSTSPYLGLVPPSRHLSVSGSPTHSGPGSPSSSSSGGATPFRSFRNLLQFGPKQTSPAASTPGPGKSPFGGLGTLRRSMHGERSVSAPHLRQERAYEESPVLAIDLPHGSLMGGLQFDADTAQDTPSAGSTSSLVRPSSAPSTESEAPQVAVSDLSTIMESETSGISKHIPALDDSRDGDHSPFGSFGPAQGAKLLRSSEPSQARTVPGRPAASRGNSVMDLSTSQVTSEVMQALAEPGDKDGWLNGVVVDIVAEDGGAEGRADESFNLSALDPDLAALLSPYRTSGLDPTVLMAVDALPSPPLPSPTRSDNGSTHSRAETARRHPRSARTSPTMAPSPLSRQTSPVRRPSALARAGGGAPNRPSAALPRLTRSVSDKPVVPPRMSPGLASPAIGRAMSSSPERQSALREPPAKATAARGEQPATRRPRTGEESGTRPTLSRLTTPSRLLTARASRLQNAAPPSTWDGDSLSTSSRPASSAGTAPSRLQSRASLDAERQPSRLRTRDRSSSVVEPKQRASVDTYHPTPSRPTAEWLGPRTVKAFAAAGLLDFDKETSTGSTSRAPSRFGTSRSSIDRDTRSHYAPSRMAFSEAGSSSSWGRRSGSISNPNGVSEGGVLSESLSTPRTFSGGSTAPTSISASSQHQQHAQSEILQLQDKHSLETGALLNALADSQRTTKLLRDENTQLRDRLQHLEDKLADAHEQLRRMQYTPPSQSVLTSKSSYQRFTDSISTHGSSVNAPSRLRSFLRPNRDPSYASTSSASPETPTNYPETPADPPVLAEPHYKRASGASSLFPVVPSNMSMLMHEDGMSAKYSSGVSARSVSPSSPTLVLSKLSGKGSRGSRHGHQQSIGSMGNISPTTANFSMATGSPGSLHLRPEHELHLGDMPNLDLDAEMDDDYDYGAS